jgi:fumarate hydratase class I
VNHPFGWSTARLEGEIRLAAAAATARAYLRPNAVDPVSGKNTGDNTGNRYPYVHFHEWEEDHLEVNLLLKGGGSENCGIQYTLPDKEIGAGRDLAGIKRCVIDAVHRAQGFGCAPGILGVGVGGDRVSSMEESKVQLFRSLGDRHPDPDLAGAEEELLEKANLLGIGPMGFGGRTTVLGVKIGTRHRLPASYFVSISYLCWAARVRRMTVRDREVTYD